MSNCAGYLGHVLRYKGFIFVEACRLGRTWRGHEPGRLRPSGFVLCARHFRGSVDQDTVADVAALADATRLEREAGEGREEAGCFRRISDMVNQMSEGQHEKQLSRYIKALNNCQYNGPRKSDKKRRGS